MTCNAIPALVALMSGRIILAGTTRLKRIPISVKMPTRTPDAIDEIHSPTGTNEKNIIKINTTTAATIIGPTITFNPFLCMHIFIY